MGGLFSSPKTVKPPLPTPAPPIPTVDTDIINLDLGEEPLFNNECCALISEDKHMYEDSLKFKERLIEGYKTYKMEKPGEAIKPQSIYYHSRGIRK